MDYYRDYGPRDKQEGVFRLFLKEAKNRNLPVIIHQRDAQKDVIKILREGMTIPIRGFQMD